MSTSPRPEYIDIGVNLTDGMYAGEYHGKKAHTADLDRVMERAKRAGVIKQMITVGQVEEVSKALEFIRRYDGLYCTAGVHPTRSSQVVPGYLENLKSILDKDAAEESGSSGRIIAIGECGLDYDRLHFSPKADQLKHFALQLQLAEQYHLPLFLHCRAAHEDFISTLKPYLQSAGSSKTEGDDVGQGRKRLGVVHCFTGSVAEMLEFVHLGLYVGLTGCSFKTNEGLEVARHIPLDCLLLETDAPWCDLRATHASAPLLAAFAKSRPVLAQLYQPASVKKEKWEETKMVKSRNEPCTIGAVAAVVAEAKGIEIEEVASAALANTRFLFGI